MTPEPLRDIARAQAQEYLDALVDTILAGVKGVAGDSPVPDATQE